jgi:hypothetical protein
MSTNTNSKTPKPLDAALAAELSAGMRAVMSRWNGRERRWEDIPDAPKRLKAAKKYLFHRYGPPPRMTTTSDR